MPGGGGTGLAGLEPMTERAAGFCIGYPVPGYMDPIGGRGCCGAGAAVGLVVIGSMQSVFTNGKELDTVGGLCGVDLLTGI
jgi:hypothetical protein